MANMSYCRFQNTLRDLRDCEEAMLEGEEPEAPEERKARRDLVRLCQEIVKGYAYYAEEYWPCS